MIAWGITYLVHSSLLIAAVWLTSPCHDPAAEPRPADEQETMHLSDGVLTQTFYGPEGYTDVWMTAKDVKMAQDASWFRFTSADGFLRVRQKTEKGIPRKIDVTPGPNGEAVREYRVANVEKPWDDEARLIVLSAFRAEKAYAGKMLPAASSIELTPKPRRATPGRKLPTWNGTVELTGTRNDIPISTHIKARGMQYDESTGEVFFEGDAFLTVEETFGDERRTFRRDAKQMVWHGAFGTTETSIGAWLTRILRKESKLPRNVIEALAKQ